VISRLIHVKLTKLEYFLAGYTLWSFIILSPMYVCLALGVDVRVFLLIANIASVILSIGTFIFLRGKMVIAAHTFFFLLLLSILIASISIIQLFTPIIYNWDAVSIYIPLAKEISSTGLYQGSNYGTTYSTTTLPFLPAFYACIISLVGGTYLRLIPAFFLMLNSIAIFCIIGRFNLQVNITSWFGIATFLMSPSIVLLAGFEGLYADLPFMFYTSVAMLFIGLYISSKDLFCLVISSAAICLSISCKEYGLFLFPMFISLTLVSARTRLPQIFKYLLLILIAFLPFFSLMFWDFWYMAKPLQHMIFRAIALLILSTLSLPFLRIIEKRTSLVSLGSAMKHVLLMLIIVSPIGFFILRNIIKFGVVTPAWAPKIAQLYVSINYPSPPQQAVDPISYFNFNSLYSSIILGFVTLPLVLLSLFYLRKGQTDETLLSVIFCGLICLTTILSFIFHFNFKGTEYRRLSIFMPFISVLATVGLSSATESFGSSKNTVGYYYISAFSLLYVSYWLLYLPVSSIRSKSLNEAPTWLYLASLLVILLPLVIKNFLNVKNVKIPHLRYKIDAVFILLLLLSVSLFSYLMYRLHYGIPSKSNESAATWYYDCADALWSPWRQLSDYIRNNTPADSKIVSFGALPLVYYTNRSFLDIDYLGVIALYDYLKCNDSLLLTSRLYNDNVRYFLIPTKNIWTADFELYNRLAKQYLVFNLTENLNDNVCLYPVLRLNEYILYKLIQQQRIPLSALGGGSTLTSDWSASSSITVQDKSTIVNGIANGDGYVDLKFSFRQPVSLMDMSSIVCNLSIKTFSDFLFEVFVYDTQGKWGSASVLETSGSWNGSIRVSWASFSTQENFDWNNVCAIKFSVKTQPFSNVILSVSSEAILPVESQKKQVRVSG